MNRSHILLICCVFLMGAQPVHAREELRIVGSSTVFPFISAVAEQFGRIGTFPTPIVEANGTGGGFKMFCAGVGDQTPDIANASRPIKPTERALCQSHGVADPVELKIGYDGIVIASPIKSPSLALSRRALFLALAREIPRNGTLIENDTRSWRQIDPKLPDTPIEVYGPPPAEGTRDAFVEMVMHEGCKQFPEYTKAYPDESLRKQHCGAMREDGRFVELLGGNVMVQKLVNNPSGLGIFSYSFLDQNRALVQANPVDGVLPTLDAIVSQRYSVARSLFIYVKREHLQSIASLRPFVNFAVSEAAVGEEGFLVVKGLIPATKREREAIRAHATSLP